MVELFEHAFTSFVRADHGVAVDSGTDALTLALAAAGVGDGDTVFVPGLAPFSTIAGILRVDATPVFVDVHPTAYTISTIDLERAIENHPDAAAVVPVHLGGQPTEMHAMFDHASGNGLRIVEDAREAPGGCYQGAHVGTIGDAGAFCFGSGRILRVNSKGGLVATGDAVLAARAAMVRDGVSLPRFGWHAATGQLDERRAATGLERLPSLQAGIDRRRELATCYTSRLRRLDRVVPPHHRSDVTHVFSSYIVNAEDAAALASRLDDADVPVTRFRVATEYPAVRSATGDTRDLRIAERLSDRLLGLPISPAMSEDDVVSICRVIERHYDRARVRP